MFGKVKKVFFTGVFGVLYVSFLAQFVYILGFVNECDVKMVCLALMSMEWLALIAARYLSKRSSTGAQHGNFNRRR